MPLRVPPRFFSFPLVFFMLPLFPNPNKMNNKVSDSKHSLETKENTTSSIDKRVFISHQIETTDCFDFQDLGRYTFISKVEQGIINPKDYGFFDRETFEEWADCEIGIHELYEIPDCDLIYYFPKSYKFDKTDLEKCSSNTTLFYDKKYNQWAVGQLIEGEDCTPNLLDTFINLGRGVPLSLSQIVSRKCSLDINPEIHKENCKKLIGAFGQEADRLRGYAWKLL